MLNIGSNSTTTNTKTKTLFGCAIHPRWFGNEVNNTDSIIDIPKSSQYLTNIKENFNSIVIEHHMKWGPILSNNTESETLGLYDFTQCDIIVDWAISNNIVIKGHVLIWHVTSPYWLKDLEPMELKIELKRHIFIMMQHYKGKIKYWDVVNEALAPNGELAENVFLKKLGSSYIDDCFRWAHEADPDAILIYNDNKVESCRAPIAPMAPCDTCIGSETHIHVCESETTVASSSQTNSNSNSLDYYEKSDAFYNLVKGMIDRGVPVHHVGLQAHFNAAAIGKGRIPTPDEIGYQIDRLVRLGLHVNISEFDIRVSKLKKQFDDENEENEWKWRLRVQEQITRKILRICHKVGNEQFLGVWWWGVHDLSSWCHKFYFTGDRPLLFDDTFHRKPAYNGVLSAFNDEDVGDEWGIVDGLCWLPVPIDSDIDINNNTSNIIVNPISNSTATSKPDWEL